MVSCRVAVWLVVGYVWFMAMEVGWLPFLLGATAYMRWVRCITSHHSHSQGLVRLHMCVGGRVCAFGVVGFIFWGGPWYIEGGAVCHRSFGAAVSTAQAHQQLSMKKVCAVIVNEGGAACAVHGAACRIERTS